MLLPVGAAAASSRAAHPAVRDPETAVRILAPAAGTVLSDPTALVVKLRLWTRQDASLQIELNQKPVPISSQHAQVVALDGAFIWTATLTGIELSPGTNRLTASVRGRRGAIESDTVTFTGPDLLGSSSDFDVTGTTVTDNSLELQNSLDPLVDKSSGLWKEVVPAAHLVKPSTSSPWHVSGEFPDFHLDYEIRKADGTPSGYWVYSHFYVPLVGDNTATCAITQTDSSGPDPQTAPAAPYSCFWSDTKGYNPHPMLTVRAATIITDKQKALNLATQNCREGAPHCIYAVNTFSAASSGQPILVGSPCVNDASMGQLTCIYGKGKTVGETNTLTTSVQVSVNFLDMRVQVTINVAYSHAWETSETFTSGASLAIDPGYSGWFTIVPVLQTASGAFLVSSTHDGQYQSQGANASFTAPTGQGAVVAHSCMLKPNTDPNNLECQGTITSGNPIPVTGTPGP